MAMEQVCRGQGQVHACAALVGGKLTGGGSVSDPSLVTGGGRRGLHVELEAIAKPDRVKF